jgi:hypothetical protein
VYIDMRRNGAGEPARKSARTQTPRPDKGPSSTVEGTFEYVPVKSLPPLWLMYASDPSESGKMHAPVRERWLQGDLAVVDGMNSLAALADCARCDPPMTCHHPNISHTDPNKMESKGGSQLCAIPLQWFRAVLTLRCPVFAHTFVNATASTMHDRSNERK